MAKVLLVEDDSGLAYATAYALKNENFMVTIANSLRKAREEMSKETYDLVLLDIMLPDGTGYDFCREIRAKSDVSIIFLTACDDEVNIVMGLDIGGDDYIIKPFRIRELISRLNAVLRRKGIHEEQIVKWSSGDITVYILEHHVYMNEEEIFLTNMEYKLLLAFMGKPHHVLTRAKLLEIVWDIDMKFVDDNTLSVYIKRLRDKLETNSHNLRYITTVRGIGYKWNMDVRRY